MDRRTHTLELGCRTLSGAVKPFRKGHGSSLTLYDLSVDMFPEDGCLWVYGVGEDGVPAFTSDGIENLRQIIADQRAAGRAPPQVKFAE
jgi:hypothetical protein